MYWWCYLLSLEKQVKLKMILIIRIQVPCLLMLYNLYQYFDPKMFLFLSPIHSSQNFLVLRWLFRCGFENRNSWNLVFFLTWLRLGWLDRWPSKGMLDIVISSLTTLWATIHSCVSHYRTFIICGLTWDVSLYCHMNTLENSIMLWIYHPFHS